MVRLDVTLLPPWITWKSMKGGVKILGLAVAIHLAQFTGHSSYNLQTAQSIFVIQRFMHRADIQILWHFA